ncbi:MAG: Lrp/AsnC family transcriptional regulator [Pseudomonadota bacterium]|jgi:DNA-binding Lrp family transcriptional regulator
MKIDSTDSQILAALDFGARQGLAPITKKVAISPQLLDYRLKSLRHRGVLIGFRPVIDSFKLGFQYYRLFVRLRDMSPRRVTRIASFARKTRQVLWCYQMNGRYNLVLSFWARSVREFEGLCHDFLAQHGDAIDDYNQDQIYRLRHFSIDRLLGKRSSCMVDIEESEEHYKIDNLDQAILRALNKDSRQPFSAIAQSCGTSDKVVAYRVERLEERKIIRGYRPIINWPLLGKYHWKVFIRLNLKRNIINQALTYIYKTPEVFCTLHGIGFPGEIDIEVVLDSYDGLFEYIARLQNALPGCVRSYEHLEFTTVHKVDYLPLKPI